MRKNVRYLSWGGVGVLLIVWHMAFSTIPRPLSVLSGAIGGFLLCQAIYGKWLADYHVWLDEAHEQTELLLGWFSRFETGKKGVN